jgi:pilus assembly protein FimV
LDARISGLEDALAVQQEETDRVNLRADELNERLRLLEEQIESVKEMVRLRDLELAQLQQSLAEAAQVAANEVAEAAVEEPIITMAPEKSFLQSLLATLMANTFALIGAVALLVLALVFVLLRRNKTKNAEALEDLDAMEPSIDGPADDASDEGAETQASEEALGEIFNLAEGLDEEMVDDSFGVPQEAAEGGDAVRELLEEADALISHERYEEAISLLQDGIVAEPNSSELRLKLLEVCVVKKDAVGFKLQETELRESASPAVLARIEELKAQLRAEVDDEILEDGDEEFFAEQESSEDVDDLELALDMEASADVDDEKVLSGVQDPEEEDESEEAAESEEPHFYSDNDGEGEEPSVLNSAADLEGDKEEADDIFDLSTDSDDDAIEFAVEEDVASAVETTEAAPSGENTEEDDANSIDFDISDLGQPEALVSTEQELESDNDIEFDFDLDDDLVTDSSVDESLDDSGSLEFDADAETAIEEVEAEPEDDEEFSVDFEDTSAGDSESVDAPVLEEKAQNKEPADDDIVFELDDEDSDSPATIRSAKEDLDIEFTGLDTDDEAGQVDSTELEPAPEAPEADDDAASEADDEFGDLQFLSDSDRKSGGDDDEDDMDFLSDTDEAATKLDLARAYFEMGDHDGAKEILDEVVKEGTQEQIEDAKALLGKL